MAIDICSLETRYFGSCERLQVLPNPSVLSSFLKVKLQKSHQDICILKLFLDELKEADFPPLIDVCLMINSSEIDAVDIIEESHCYLDGDSVLSLMRTINHKLRVVDLQVLPSGNKFLRDLSRRGLMCQVLNLRSCRFRNLNMIGNFIYLHTLNLDFSISLRSFRENCFTCMPNLMRLSMCGTRVVNLWTTSAALSKLPSLVELRFQNCMGCDNTGPCSASSTEKANMLVCNSIDSEETLRSLFSFNDLLRAHIFQNKHEDSSDDSEEDFPSQQWGLGLAELLSDFVPIVIGQADLQNVVSLDPLWNQNQLNAANNALKKYISHHPSPICFEKHYREYMITSLPRLEVLDNLPIKNMDRIAAKNIYSQYYEYLPYKRQKKESVISVLQKREMGASSTPLQKSLKLKQSYPSVANQYFFSRSLCAAKLGTSAWPLLQNVSREESKSFRPRQFEYHPSNSSLMVFGTLDGELVVVNHESGNLIGYIPSTGAMTSILGLSWLKKYPSKLIVGSDNGLLKLYDVHYMPSTITNAYHSGGTGTVTFDDFEHLTSVHVNATDELFLTSGYSKNVALYDISTGRRLQMFTNMHREHINVVKFAHHSPSIFATSSFDQDVKLWDLRQKPVRPCYTASSSRGNVMVCFSPDDHYLLASAIDNEVNQLLAVDGRLHMKFEIAATRHLQNYTRSYYMNGRDYIISGSCGEQVIRICCAQTGRRLRDISLEDMSSRYSMFVQSLRGDPFRDFHMSVLAACMHPRTKSQIIKVNLLGSNDHVEEYHGGQSSPPPSSMGG